MESNNIEIDNYRNIYQVSESGVVGQSITFRFKNKKFDNVLLYTSDSLPLGAEANYDDALKEFYDIAKASMPAALKTQKLIKNETKVIKDKAKARPRIIDEREFTLPKQ